MKHFGKIAYSWLILFSLIFITLALTACHSSQPTVANYHSDEKNILKHYIDTIMLHDSIFIKEYTVTGEAKDTVFVIEYRTQYRYKVRQLHDTIAIIVRDSIPVYTAPPTADKSNNSSLLTSHSSLKMNIFGIVFAIMVIIPIAALSIKYLIGK